MSVKNRRWTVLATCGAVATLGVACASPTTTDREEYEGPRLARPDRILIYDFAAIPQDLPSWTDAASRYSSAGASPSASQVDTGRKLGAEVARELVQRIGEMGLTAVRAADAPGPRPGEIAIVGWFTSVDPGSATERIALGFGEGAAELTARVEGYESTAEGMRKLGAGTVSSGEQKSPGLIAPLAVTVATANPIGLIVGTAVKAGAEASGTDTIKGAAKRVADTVASELQPKFEEQGWIDGP